VGARTLGFRKRIAHRTAVAYSAGAEPLDVVPLRAEALNGELVTPEGNPRMPVSDELRQRREAIVRQHLDAENRQDVQGVLDTFATPKYDVKALGAVNDGAESVHELMTGLFNGFPDFHVNVLNIHHSDNAVIVEEIFGGTHNGPWAGVSATGRKMQVPCACVFEFDGDRLTCEKLYFDLATVLRQLGAMD
jgi:steroid delta-isomerase-like uncharacterized protein